MALLKLLAKDRVWTLHQRGRLEVRKGADGDSGQRNRQECCFSIIIMLSIYSYFEFFLKIHIFILVKRFSHFFECFVILHVIVLLIV